MSFGFFFDASSLSHSLSSFSERLSAESEEGIWYMSDNSKRCLYPFLKIGLVQLKKSLEMTLAFSRGDLCMVPVGVGVPAGEGRAASPKATLPRLLGACRSPLFL